MRKSDMGSTQSERGYREWSRITSRTCRRKGKLLQDDQRSLSGDADSDGIFVALLTWGSAAAQDTPRRPKGTNHREGTRICPAIHGRTAQFICTETMVRSSMDKKSESWRPVMKLTSDLTYSEKSGRSHKLLTINDQPTKKSFSSVNGGNTRDFGTTLQLVFQASSEARFQWERSTDLRGQMVHVFSYHVDQAHSTYTLTSNGVFKHGQQVTAGFSGLVYVERETHRVLRITFLPVGTLATLNSELDYGFADIAGQSFLLPLHAEAVVHLKDGTQYRNVTDYSNYRKFSSKATLKFEP